MSKLITKFLDLFLLKTSLFFPKIFHFFQSFLVHHFHHPFQNRDYYVHNTRSFNFRMLLNHNYIIIFLFKIFISNSTTFCQLFHRISVAIFSILQQQEKLLFNQLSLLIIFLKEFHQKTFNPLFVFKSIFIYWMITCYFIIFIFK